MTEAHPIALVTGGSAGIGEDLCRHLLEAGYRVLNLSRRPAQFEHERLESFAIDLSDTAATRALMDDLTRRYAITNLIHNAGVIRPALVDQVDLDDLDHLTRLHLSATVIMTQAVLPAMREARFGRIVVISSRALLGLETRTSYASTKAGQIGLVRTWAMELGRFGVTVNAVAPGPIVTDMFHELIPEDSPKKEAIARSVPMKRLGRPDDVSRAVMFLLDPENDFITGQTLFVCGGASLGSLSL